MDTGTLAHTGNGTSGELLPFADLYDVTMAVLGTGSLGGFAALSAAGHGVGHLVLADNGCLKADGVRRHVAGLEGVNRPKSDSVEDALKERYPSMAVESHQFCFLGQPKRLGQLIGKTHIALVALARESACCAIDQILWKTARTGVFVRLCNGGSAAELILVDPRHGTACYSCAAGALARIRRGAGRGEAGCVVRLHRPDGQARAGTAGKSCRFRGDGAEHDTRSEAPVSSILAAAALAADLAAAWLEARLGFSEPLDAFRRQGASAWRLAFRPVRAWGVGPWRLEPVLVEPRPACAQRCTARALARQRAAESQLWRNEKAA